MNRTLMLCLLLMQAGCAMQPLTMGLGSSGDVEFLNEALDAEAAELNAMWREIETSRSPDPVRRALLLSVPGHDAHDANAARRELGKLVEQLAGSSRAEIARLRLREVETLARCQAQHADLSRRMRQMIEIEREIGTSND